MLNLYARLAPYLITLIEALLLLGAGALILASSRNSSARSQPTAFGTIEHAFARLATRKWLSIALVGISVIGIRVALIPILGIPRPGAHDEFSYLLAADTFAHGKITNASHPMWIYFESFHIIQHPTYMSIYPPAQGLVLAMGQLLGHPWIGQLLVTALLYSALCWMLQGWLPPSWALLGALLAVLRVGILSYWTNGYWSASVVALGGALVLGAWPRVRRHLRIRDALLLALGLVILANSRPFEGLVFAIPVAFTMFFWLLGRDRPAFGRSLPRVVVPILFSLLLAAVATGYYYHRVTGSPFRMAYQVNGDAYGAPPFFIWQTPVPEPAYHHEVISDFYHSEQRQFQANRTLAGYLLRTTEKIIPCWQFYLSPLLTLPLLALPLILRQRKMRLPLLICAALAAALAVETWTLPHYFAPATGALYLLLVQGIRYLWQWSPNRRPIGKALVRALPVLACAMILLRVVASFTHTYIEPAWPRGNLERASMLRQLQQLPGLQLVMVNYGPRHNLGEEWVYNQANIDAAKVVWARDKNNHDNQELLSYFKDRRVWRLNADASPRRLELYALPHE